MSPYEELATMPGVSLFLRRLPKKVNGLCVKSGGHVAVVLNLEASRAVRRSALAEELYHIKLGHYGNFAERQASYGEKLRLGKQEREAKSRAAEELISDEEIKRYLDIDVHVSEVADELWVSEELVRIKVDRLKGRR